MNWFWLFDRPKFSAQCDQTCASWSAGGVGYGTGISTGAVGCLFERPSLRNSYRKRRNFSDEWNLQRRARWAWQSTRGLVRRAATGDRSDAPAPPEPCRPGRRTPATGSGEARGHGARTPSASSQTCSWCCSPQDEWPSTTECRMPPDNTTQQWRSMQWEAGNHLPLPQGGVFTP